MSPPDPRFFEPTVTSPTGERRRGSGGGTTGILTLEAEASVDAASGASAPGENSPKIPSYVSPRAQPEPGGMTPARIGQYRIESTLGQGGMGEVFLAWDERLQRHVAIKKIRPDLAADPAHRARFRREARAAARLSHPAIVQIFDILESEDGDCIVMERVEGEALGRRIRGCPQAVRVVVSVARDIAAGLAEAHAKGLVHRDLKPENVMITPGGQAKILDFGLARVLHSEPRGSDEDSSHGATLTQAGALVGTIHAMSPEQAGGAPVDHRSDLFALGGLIYEMLTGRAPFRGDNTLDSLRRILSEEPAPLSAVRPDLPPDLERLVGELLAKHPDSRPVDADAVVQRLDQVRIDFPDRFAVPPDGAVPDGEAGSRDWTDLPTGEWGASPFEHEAIGEGTAEEAAERSAKTAIQVLWCVEWAGRPSVADGVWARHDRRLRELLPQSDGREIDKGSGYLALFERPADAVACAVEYQRIWAELRTASADGSTFGAATMRSAVHFGEVRLLANSASDIEHGARPFEVEGPARDQVLRLAGLARPGQILMSRTAFDLARRALDHPMDGLRWLAHGPYMATGEDEPLELFEVGVDGLAPLAAPEDSEAARRVFSPSEARMLGWRPAAGLTIPRRPHWTLRSRVGEGGFGEVWLAEHKSGEQRVFKFCFEADRLKALKREVTLFRLLRDTLGHREDIARILDWQFDEAPFFVESAYTEGGNLVDWAAQQGGVLAVPLETRLRLAAEVADALAAAHSVGVLHKDVKPSNVLVTFDRDGEPRACLTDFGIGLLTDKSRLETPGFTAMGFTETLGDASGSNAGTLGYVAPELLAGRAATMQADIYSLGVLVYQLVAGDFNRHLAPGWERDVDDELLAEDIGRWVDGVPERRPAGARDVASDLRTLDARRRTRSREKARLEADLRNQRLRSRAVAAAVISLVVALMVGFMALRESRARTLAASEAERANRQSMTAQRVTEVMVDMFRMSDPNEAKGNTVTAREILDRGLERIETELDDEPEIQAELKNTMAEVYHGLGVFPLAERLAKDALGVRRGLWGERHPKIADTLALLGETRLRKGDYVEGEEFLTQAVAVREEQLATAADEASRQTVRLLIADHHHVLGRWLNHRETRRAEGLLQRAYAVRAELLGEDADDTLETRRHLLTALLYQGRIVEGERQMTDFLSRWRRLHPEPTPELANILKTLGQIRWLAGLPEKAQMVAEEALDMDLQVHGPEHSNTLLAYSILGGIRQEQGRLDEAEALFRRTVEAYRRLDLRTHYAAKGINGLAWVLFDRQGCESAEPLVHEALEIVRGELKAPDDAPQLAIAEALLGICGLERGDPEAEALLVRAHDVLEAKQSAHAPRTRRARERLITHFQRRGDYEKAAAYRKRDPARGTGGA